MTESTTTPVLQGGKLTEAGPAAKVSQRLLSLDFMRGLTMVLLALESARLYGNIQPALEGSAGIHLLNEFFHHPWHGLHLWDLVQPVFMFAAGTAMAFSYKKQRQTHTWGQAFRKTLKRCFWLFFWGVLDYAVVKDHLELRLWDVLTQLSFTTLVTFLIMSWDVKWQIVVSLLCLLIPEFLYRFTHIPNYDQPFTDQQNFGNYMDMVLMGRVNKGGWVAINCVSTSAHTIWGALCGQLLLSDKPQRDKVKTLVIAGLVLLALGFGLDWAGVTPIIKKIATSTFVLASGGWAVLFLALCYWWVDIRKHQKNMLFFLIFGMNSIFIYLFFEIVGDRWFTEYIFTITNSLFGYVHMPVILAGILGSFVVFGLEAGILYFLYKRKIFFKL